MKKGVFIISTLYPQYDNNFPSEGVDNFEKFIDPDINSLQAINLYYQYYNAGNISQALNVLSTNQQLKRMIINAENLNKLRDAVMSIEQFYLDDIQQYIVELVQYRGEYVASVKYNKYNVVSYAINGLREAYMCVSANTPVGTNPTNITYWIPLAIRGEKGDAGIGLAFQGEYDPLKTYQKNDCVQYLGSLYGALQTTTGNTPTEGGNNDYWALAWNFQIPDYYVTMNMLSNDVQQAIASSGTFNDDTLPQTYRLGADNERPYIERVS